MKKNNLKKLNIWKTSIQNSTAQHLIANNKFT